MMQDRRMKNESDLFDGGCVEFVRRRMNFGCVESDLFDGGCVEFVRRRMNFGCAESDLFDGGSIFFVSASEEVFFRAM